MLRTIWMVVEGLLAAFGVVAIIWNVFTFRKAIKDQKTMDLAENLYSRLVDKKQD